MQRERDLRRLLDHGAFDLVVIGGGAAGAGTLRAAALRGLSAALVERGDFASGTTSRSSRLIHGGLRYLEHGHLRLVRESLGERAILIGAAPTSSVRSRSTFRSIAAATARSRILGLGLRAYDVLAGSARLAPSRILDPDAVPGLAREGLVAIGAVTDAHAVSPERLVIETLVDAERLGALAVNHLECLRITKVAERFEILVRDRIGGETGAIFARAVVNAGGPWVGEIEARAEPAPGLRRRIRFVRGSHLLLAPFPGAPTVALLAEARRDGRPFFVLPWGDVLGVGTTEVDAGEDGGDPGSAVASAAEIDYLLESLAHVWPAARGVAPLATYAGMRPLPAGVGNAAAASRRHRIEDARARGGPAGFFTIAGGKLTTHRLEGEEAARAVARFLKTGDGSAAEPTRTRPFPGVQCDPGPALDPAALAQRMGIEVAAAERLLRRWGCRAWAVATGIGNEPPLPGAAGLYAAEIRFALEHEGAHGLDDVLCRRTGTWESPALTARGLAAAARVWAGDLPDREAVAAAESERVLALLARATPPPPLAGGPAGL